MTSWLSAQAAAPLALIMEVSQCPHFQSDLGPADVTQSICRFLLPFHAAAACSRALRDALAEQAREVTELLCKLEVAIEQPLALHTMSTTQLKCFTFRRSNIDVAAAAICPKGRCGSQACMRAERRLDWSWLADVDWQCFGPCSDELRATFGKLAEALPARVVEHTHFQLGGEFRVGELCAVEKRDVHVLLPVGERSLEFAYCVECARW